MTWKFLQGGQDLRDDNFRAINTGAETQLSVLRSRRAPPLQKRSVIFPRGEGWAPRFHFVRGKRGKTVMRRGVTLSKQATRAARCIKTRAQEQREAPYLPMRRAEHLVL